MTVVVKLSDVIDALEAVSDSRYAYLHKTTGQIVLVSEGDLRAAESGDDELAVDDASLDEARAVVGSDDYLELPTGFDIHEYSIMERFSRGVAYGETRDELACALRGRGAFRMFRDVVSRRGLLDDWYDFRRHVLAEIAEGWLEAHGIGSDGVADARSAPPN